MMQVCTYCGGSGKASLERGLEFPCHACRGTGRIASGWVFHCLPKRDYIYNAFALVLVGSLACWLFFSRTREIREGVAAGGLISFLTYIVCKDLSPRARKLVAGSFLALLGMLCLVCCTPLGKVFFPPPAKHVPSDPFSGLLADLDSPDPTVRAGATKETRERFKQFKDGQAKLRPLVREFLPRLAALLKDKAPAVRINAACALGYLTAAIEPEQAKLVGLMPALVDAAKDSDEEVVAAAVTTLALLGPTAKDVAPRVVALLDEAKGVQFVRIANAVLSIDPSQARKVALLLLPLVADPDDTVAVNACWVLSRAGARAAPLAPDLWRIIQKEDRLPVQLEAIRALVELDEMTAKNAAPILIQIIRGIDNADARTGGAIRDAMTRGANAQGNLRLALEALNSTIDPLYRLRKEAVVLLTRIDPQAAVINRDLDR